MSLEKLAQNFYEAYKNKTYADTISGQGLNLDEKNAYELQDLVTKLKIEENGEKIIGYKISMTSERMQKMGNANSPAYGTFTSNSVSDGKITLNPESPYLIEPELVFIIQDDLSIDAGPEEIIRNSKIAAGLEIPGSRYANWFPPKEGATVIDTIADNAVAGFIVVGEECEIPQSIDWKNIKTTLYHNGNKIDEGFSSEVLGNPVNAVSWLTTKLAERNQFLRKDMLVSAGTFTDPKVLQKGNYQAVYDIVGEISITVQ